MRIDRRRVLACGLLLGLLAGCGDDPGARGEVTIGAAASLRRVLPELIDAYRAEHPEARFAVTYAGSGTLRAQVDAGAPIDGVLLASDRQIDLLVERGAAEDDTRTVVARNVLVLVAGKDSPAKDIATLATLPERARVALGAPDAVPVGHYARSLLRKRGLWDALQDRLVYARDVSAVVAYVRRGEAAAGFAYATDARGVEDLTVLEVADGAEDPEPRVVGAVVRGAAHGEAFRAFLGWLASPKATARFAAHGFGAP